MTYNQNKIKYIIHLSDIHIRLNKREKEYNEVFNNLYEKIDSLSYNKNEALIIIVGDLFHEKKYLSSESIILAVNFLKNLSIRHRTIIIPGNHDCQEINKIDIISGLLYEKNIENLYYYKDSCIQKFDNILFGITSVYDENILSINKLNEYIQYNKLVENNLTKIALYHGIVGNIKFKNIYIENCKNIDDFKGYDYVFLGDIHKYQYLDDERKIAYCSSLISQNFSEIDENHGFLLWDLEQKTSKYYKIYNNYAYKKSTLKNNLLTYNDQTYILPEDLDKLKKILPFNCNLQIETYENDNYDNTEIIKKLKTDLYDLENIDIKTNIIKNNDKKDKIILSNRKEIIQQILKDSQITDNIDSNIIEWINQIISNNDSGIDKGKYSIKFLKLNFSNMFNYSENNQINFENFKENTIINLNGKNSYGKSVIIDIISFALYDSYARILSNVKKECSNVINNDKNYANCELLLYIGNNLYLINRKYKRNKKRLIEILSFLYKLDTNSSQNIDDIYNINKKENVIYIYNNTIYNKILIAKDSFVNKEIIELIGSKDSFIMQNIFLQYDNISIFNKNNGERKDLLYQLLNLNQYNDIKNKYNVERRKINKDYECSMYLLEKIDKTELENKIGQLNIDINEITKNISNCLNEKKILLDNIEKNNKLLYVSNNINSLPKKEILNNQLQELLSKIDILKIQKNECENQNINLCSYDIDELIAKKKNIFDINISKTDLEKELQEYYNRHKSIIKELKKKEILLKKYKKIFSENNEKRKNLEIEKNYIEYHLNNLNKNNENIIKHTDKTMVDLLNEKDILSLRIENIESIINKYEENIIKLKNEKKDNNNLKNQIINCFFDYKNNINQMNDTIKMINYKDIYNKKERLILIKKEKEKIPIININNIINDIKLLKEQINTIEKDIERTKNELNIHTKNEKSKKYNSHIDILIKESKLKKTNEYLIIDSKKEIEILSDRINSINSMLDIYNKNENLIINEKINKEQEKYNLLVDKINDLRVKKLSYENTKKSIIEKLEDLNEEYKKFNNINLEKIRYDCLCEVLDKFPLFLLKKYLCEISEYINNSLKTIINKNINIYEINDKINIDIIDNNNMKVHAIGGSENFIINLLFRCSICKICNYSSSSNLLIIDEQLSSLDNDNINKNLNEIFNFMSKYYSLVIIITHIDEIKDKINHKIEIKKINKYSHVYI